MIIKGKSRGNGAQLGNYLVTKAQNEDIRVVEIRGVSAPDVPGAVREMDALTLGTGAKKGLYHAHINVPVEERLTDEQRAIAVDRLEAALGFSGQPRVVVVHEKKGREHTHVVWSRVDVRHMRVISDSFNFRAHELAARALEREFGHKRVQGAHIEREAVPRPERTPSQWEMTQAERTGLNPKEIKKQLTDLWRAADSGQAFAAALSEHGYVLARGDRRDFVVIDARGGVHSLSRRIEGATAKDIRERLADLDPRQLPSIEEAKGIQYDRAHGITPAHDQRQWEDKLLVAGLEHEKKVEKGTLRISEKFVARDLAWHEKQAARPYTATEKRLMDAYDTSRNDQEFAGKLGKAGLSLAVATAHDVERLTIERAVAFGAARPGEQTRLPPQLRPGELVAINRYGEIRRLNPHKIDLVALETRITEGTGHKPGCVIQARDRALADRPPEKHQRPSQELRTADARKADPGRSHGTAEGPRAEGRLAEGVARAALSVLDGIASIFERGISGDGEAQGDQDKAPPPSARDEHEEQKIESVRDDEAAKTKLRQEFLREFGKNVANEQEADRERGRDRTRR